MAEHVINGVRIKIDTDAEKAERDLAKIAESAEKAKRKISLSFDGDNWTGGGSGGGSGGGAPTAADSQRMSLPNKLKAAGRKVAEVWNSEIVSGGKAAAVAIGHELVRASLEFQRAGLEAHAGIIASREAEMRLAKSESAYDSFNTGAGIGGGLGLALGGPLGAMIGAGLGGGLGALAGWWKGGNLKDIEQTTRTNARVSENIYTKRGEDIGFARSQSEMGFALALERMSGRTSRIQLIEEQLANIKSGGGANSLRSLNRQYNAMSEGEKETVGGRFVYQQIREQVGRIRQLELQKQEIEAAMPMTRPYEEGRFADDMTRRGLFVGASVDVADVNKSILSELRKQTELYRQMMNNPQEVVNHSFEAMFGNTVN